MTENNNGQEPIESLPSEFCWEQMVAYSSAVEHQLATATASRSQAEAERQHIAKEILSATKEACREILANAKQALERIKAQSDEAEQQQQEAKLQLEEATSLRAEADSYKKVVLTRADKQAEELLERAKVDAAAASTKLKQQVDFEAQRMLAQAEAMRAAAAEELAAQKIYTEAAMLKAEAHQAWGQLKTASPAVDQTQNLELAGQKANQETVNGSQQVKETENSSNHKTASAAVPAQTMEQGPGPQITKTNDVTTGPPRSVPVDSNAKCDQAEQAQAPQETGREGRSKKGGPRSVRAKDRRVKTT